MVWAGVCPVPRPSPPPPALGNIWEAELPDHLWGPVPLSTGRGQEEPHNTLGNLRTPRATLGPQCALESHSPPPRGCRAALAAVCPGAHLTNRTPLSLVTELAIIVREVSE